MQLILRLPWYVDQTFCHSVLQCCCLGWLASLFRPTETMPGFAGSARSDEAEGVAGTLVGGMRSRVLLSKAQSHLKIQGLLSPHTHQKQLQYGLCKGQAVKIFCYSAMAQKLFIFRKKKAEKIVVDREQAVIYKSI